MGASTKPHESMSWASVRPANTVPNVGVAGCRWIHQKQRSLGSGNKQTTGVPRYTYRGISQDITGGVLNLTTMHALTIQFNPMNPEGRDFYWFNWLLIGWLFHSMYGIYPPGNWHIPPGEKENHLQNAILGRYVSSLEGIHLHLP